MSSWWRAIVGRVSKKRQAQFYLEKVRQRCVSATRGTTRNKPLWYGRSILAVMRIYIIGINEYRIFKVFFFFHPRSKCLEPDVKWKKFYFKPRSLIEINQLFSLHLTEKTGNEWRSNFDTKAFKGTAAFKRHSEIMFSLFFLTSWSRVWRIGVVKFQYECVNNAFRCEMCRQWRRWRSYVSVIMLARST